jgi:2-methylisocitrate lyase-like PEP mutase family enzyme
MSTQEEKAEAFRGLHHRKQILVLLNAWDAASARIFEVAGAPAIATTSSGLAAARGYPDGQKIPRDMMVAALRQICRIVDIPVSADIEWGYGTTVGEVCDTVKAVIGAGAIGINIEDAMQNPTLLVERIGAIREAAAARDVPLFINARTDVYLRGQGEPAARFADAVRRLRAYEAAGADGLFAPGLGEPEVISKLLREIHLPLNILAGQGVPAAKELEGLGVKRVSMGGGLQRAALTQARRVAAEVLETGSYDGFLADTISHAELSTLLRQNG